VFDENAKPKYSLNITTTSRSSYHTLGGLLQNVVVFMMKTIKNFISTKKIINYLRKM
jgi:hypothetical protein